LVEVLVFSFFSIFSCLLVDFSAKVLKYSAIEFSAKVLEYATMFSAKVEFSAKVLD